MANPFFSERDTDLLLALEAVGISEDTDPVEEGDDGDEDEDEYFKFLCNECGHAFDGDPETTYDDGDEVTCPECGSVDIDPN